MAKCKKMEPQQVATTEVRGIIITVTAATFGMLRPMHAAQGDTAKTLEIMGSIVAKCCRHNDGSPLNVDELTMPEIERLFLLALGKGDDSADFPA